MDKLEKLFQQETGYVYPKRDETILYNAKVLPIGQMKTLVVEHPCIEISNVIDSMATNNSKFIPEHANAYIASEYSPDTQFLRQSESGVERFHSVYAIQFYHLIKNQELGQY